MFIFDATVTLIFICVLARIVTELTAENARTAAGMQRGAV